MQNMSIVVDAWEKSLKLLLDEKSFILEVTSS